MEPAEPAAAKFPALDLTVRPPYPPMEALAVGGRVVEFWEWRAG